MARTFQNLRIFVNMSVLENVLVGCHRHEHSGILVRRPRLPRRSGGRRSARASGPWMPSRLVGLEEIAHRPAASLPYGPAALVEIARASRPSPGCSCSTSRRPA